MKKITLYVALFIATMFASCSNKGGAAVDTDSAMDSVVVVEPVVVDSVAVDVVPTDSVVCSCEE